MSRTELRAQAAVLVYSGILLFAGGLLHLDASQGLLVVLDLADLVALSERRLARSKIRSSGESDEPHPVGHDYPLARSKDAEVSEREQRVTVKMRQGG